MFMGPEVTEPKDGCAVGNSDRAHLTEDEQKSSSFLYDCLWVKYIRYGWRSHGDIMSNVNNLYQSSSVA